MATLSFVYSRDTAGEGEEQSDSYAAAASIAAAGKPPSTAQSPRHVQASGSSVSSSRSSTSASAAGRLPLIQGAGSLRSGQPLTPAARFAARGPLTRTLDEALRAQEQRELARTSARQKVHDERLALYTCPVYGTPEQRAELKRDHRQQLLTTILAREQERKQQATLQRDEGRGCIAADRRCSMELKALEHQHSASLTVFRDENKRLIELREAERLRKRQEQLLFERELLKHNPINWSGTLT